MKVKSSRKYRIIEHTADIGLIAKGQNLAQAFANAGIGMFSLITDLRKIKKTVTKFVEVSEDGPELLLFEWLNVLLYYFDTQNLIFRHIVVKNFSSTNLIAECIGEPFDYNRHTINNSVKSATMHLINVDEGKNSVRVIFDI